MAKLHDLRIRHATPADRAEHLRMRVALWGKDNSKEFLDAEIDEIIEAGQVVLLAATARGEVIGFAEVAIHHSAESCDTRNVGYLEGWWVDVAYRRQGVGARLVTAAEDWARERGALEFASGCDLDNAASAVAHKALGFEETHRTIHFRKPLASEEAIARATVGSTTC